MTLQNHVKITGMATAAMLPYFSYMQIFLFAVGSIFIDIDHYFFYIAHRGKFDIQGMFNYFKEIKKSEPLIPYTGLCLFHTLDFFIIIGLLTWTYPILCFLLAGCLLHFILDIISLYRNHFLFGRPFCILEHFIRKRRYGSSYPFV